MRDEINLSSLLPSFPPFFLPSFLSLGATLLTIAHRIFTLVDYNRIAVLDAGTVVEYDAPLVRA